MMQSVVYLIDAIYLMYEMCCRLIRDSWSFCLL